MRAKIVIESHSSEILEGKWMSVGLTKIDVARRQLVAAIRLFFEDRDEIVVFTLAANAWEVVDVLCGLQGIESLSKETQGHLNSGKSLKYDYVNDPYRNFFKHADRDPNSVLKGFCDKRNDGLLMLAVEDYIRLVGSSPIEFQIYQLWFLGKNREKIASHRLQEVMTVVHKLFPAMDELRRKDQKVLGKKAIERSLKNDDLLADVGTDTREIDRWR